MNRAPARNLMVLLAVPAIAVLMLAFLAPLLNLANLSFYENLPGGALREVYTLASYRELISDRFYLELTRDSVLIAVEASLLALLIGYPIALFLYRTTSRWRGLLMVLAISPLFVSGVVRVFGWLVILGDTGFINGLLKWTGLISQPIALIFNWTGVVIGLAEGLVPFVILALIAGFGRLDQNIEDAAATLGANPVRRFLRITLPLSLPGILLGLLIGFVVSMSAYISPRVLGGGRVFVLATEIYNQTFELNNWPLAAALALYMLVLLVLVTFAYKRVAERYAT
jgi:putative spermidine/putrescine transport system permease protein